MNFRIKYIFFILCTAFLTTTSGLAQPPEGYYDTATGNGFQLKTQLHNIIKDHQVRLYNELWAVFPDSDADFYYDHDGTVLDIYSENPAGADPYTYSFFVHQCGNFNAEGQCYNREHLMPTSVFNGASPMDSDIHHIFPTDGWVNNRRDILPFGIVNNPSYTSQNGSKRGSNSTPGYSAGAFEVIDEFKGDVARALLYFGTRYEDLIAEWNHPMLNNTGDQVFSDWFLSLLLTWHKMDPPSEREINRNNVAYEFQGNRNPFIDVPDFADRIWNPGTSLESREEATAFSIFPNPSAGEGITLLCTKPVENIFILTTDGKVVRTSYFSAGPTEVKIQGLHPGFYVLYVQLKDGQYIHKLIVR